jgi:hypothetical protein
MFDETDPTEAIDVGNVAARRHRGQIIERKVRTTGFKE